MEGVYVDLHCHLLPGLDDGAAAMEDTIAHARRLEAAGVHDVACTPHIKRIDFPHVEIARLAGLRLLHDLSDSLEFAFRLHLGARAR